MKYTGLLTFLPVAVPPMPYPYRPEDTAVDRWNYLKLHPGGDLNEQQKIINSQTVAMANRLAESLVVAYNSQIIRYYDNGGAKNKFGLTLPTALPVLESTYRPAQDATAHYDPATKKWIPSTIHLETEPWSLPAGTILFVQS